MSCRLAPCLGGGGGLEFFQVQKPIKSGKAGLLHIPSYFPEKIRAVLLPQGSLGIEGLEIFSKSL